VHTYLLIALQSFHNKKNTDSSELIKDQILEQQQGKKKVELHLGFLLLVQFRKKEKELVVGRDGCLKHTHSGSNVMIQNPILCYKQHVVTLWIMGFFPKAIMLFCMY
jgi:hypothetical protein